MYTKHLLGMAGLALGIAVSVTVATADIRKVYPGAACQPFDDNANVRRTAEGIMQNNSNNTQDWICAVERNTIAANAVDGIVDAVIGVIDNNNSGADPKVTCTLYSRSKTTGLTDSEVQNSPAGASPNVRELNYGSQVSATGGYYYFHCKIPPVDGANKSGIAWYRIDEHQ